MNLFRKGIVDALPVFAGYLSVGFTFGLAAAPAWHSAALPVAASMTHLSGTGQFVILSLLGAGSSLAAVMAGIIAINFRYVPMAMAVSQRLDPEMPLWQRLVVAMGDTDEIVGISLGEEPPLRFPYMAGLLVCSWCGWVGGTVLGANPATQSLIPERLTSALGIAFPAMFAAIVLPALRKSRRIAVAATVAAAASLALRALPSKPDEGWATLMAGTAAAAVAAAFRQPEGEDGR